MNDIDHLGSLAIFKCLYPYKYDTVLKACVERDSPLLFELANINRLVLGSNKTKFLRFKPHIPNNMSSFNIYVDGEQIYECEPITFLGMHLMYDLLWGLHIQKKAPIGSL